jgi:predicted lipoprotein
MGTTARGLPVLEYLLFGGDIVEDSGRCQVALAVAEDLASLAGAMAASWADPQEGYAAQLLNGGGDFGSTHALFAEVLSRLGFTVEDIRRDRLNAPLGEDDASAAPESVESWPSGRSLADIRDSLRGVNEVFEGAAPDGVGLTDMLEFRRRADTVGAYRGAYADVLVKLAAVPEPLSDSILYERHAIVALEASLAELQRVIQVDIGNVLSASLTFNDADGD